MSDDDDVSGAEVACPNNQTRLPHLKIRSSQSLQTLSRRRSKNGNLSMY